MGGNEALLARLRERERRRLTPEAQASGGRLVATNVPSPQVTLPAQPKQSGVSRLVSRLTTPLVDVPTLPGGIAGRIVEQGIEGLTSPIGLASAALIPVTGGASLGLRGAAGVGARLATRGLAEVAVGGAAGTAAQEVAERLPEGTPGIIKVPLTLAAGATAGIGAARGISAGLRSTGAVTPEVVRAALPTNTPEAGILTEAISSAKAIPKSEQKQLLRAQRVEQAQRFERGLSGTNTTATAKERIAAGRAASGGEFTRLAFQAPEVDPKVVESLYQQGLDYYQSRGLSLSTNTIESAIDKLLAGAVPPPHELRAIEEVFGPGLVEAVRMHRGWGAKAAEALNLPRALVASADLSAPLRQGVLLSVAHPRSFTKNMLPMLRAFADEDYFKRTVAELDGNTSEVASALALRATKADLARTAGKITSKEEAFLGNMFRTSDPTSLLNKAVAGGDRPLLGRLMDASERAYSLYLDKLRRDVFTTFTKRLDAAGIDSLATEKEYAAFLNRATGRGSEKVLSGNLGKVANAAFFAPNYAISRFLAPTSLATSDRVVQKQVAKDLGGFVAAGIGGLTLLHQAAKTGLIPNLTVQADPRSSDFGKIRIGDTRYDFWGGYQQIARTIAQTAMGESKSASGRVSDADRAVTVGRFFQSKLSPALGVGVDVLRGESYNGDQLDVSPESLSDQALARLTPLVMQDIMEGFNDSGIRGAVGSTPSIFGVGVTTFQSLGEIKDNVALRVFGKDSYRDLTGEQQKAVDQDPRVLNKQAEYDGKRGDSFAKESEIIDQQRIMSQRAFMARLASNGMDRKQFADAIEENQLRASVARDKARQIYGVPDAEPTSPLQMALDQYYRLYDEADLGTPFGVKTGQIDWDRYESLKSDLYKKLSPEQIDFIDQRAKQEQDPTVQWYFNDKDYISKSGYYDTMDEVAARFGPDSYSELVLKAAAGDARAKRLAARVSNSAGTKKEAMRRKDPRLDRALFETGRTTKLLTRAAREPVK